MEQLPIAAGTPEVGQGLRAPDTVPDMNEPLRQTAGPELGQR